MSSEARAAVASCDAIDRAIAAEHERAGDGGVTLAAIRREAAMIGLAVFAYVGIRAVTEGRTELAEQNAYAMVRLQRGLGIAWEGWLQSQIVGRDVLVSLANWIYIYGHWPVIATVAVLLFVTRRDRYRLLRNAVFISGALGFLFFAFVPMAPPRLIDLGLIDTVAEQSRSYRALQPPSLTNQYAALPSLHFGWNLLVGIVLFGTTRRLVVRVFAVVMPALMAFAVVATANHFVLDIVVGGLVVLLGLAAAVSLQRAATLAAGGSQQPGAEPVPDRARLR
jgi:membrane-associated phospholipid phosphatase